MGSFQRRGDDLAFHLFQRTQPRNRAGRAWSCRSNRLGKILRLQNVVLADGRAVACAREDDRTLKRIPQLAHVSRPRISGKHASCRLTQLHVGTAVRGTKSRQQMVCEQ